MIKDIRLKLNIILEYLIAILLVIGANSIYSHLDSINIHVNIVTILLLIAYVFNKVIIKYKVKSTINNIKKIFRKYFLFFGIYFVLMIIFFILNHALNVNFISVYLVMLPLFILIYGESKKSIITIMKNIVIIVAIVSVVSLLLYLLIDVFHLLKYSNEVKIAWGGTKKVESFYYLYFKTQNFYISNHTLIRNTSIYTEAPMFSLILTLSICFNELFLKTNKFARYIFIVAMISTFSTTGYIAVTLIYMLLILFKSKINKRLLFFILTIPLILCFMLFFSRLKTSSGSTRIDDYLASYKTWVNSSKHIGNLTTQRLHLAIYKTTCMGGNEDAIFENVSDFRRHNMGLSNSFMVVLAEGGIYLLLLYLIPFIYTSIKFIKEKNWNYVVFNIIMLFLFFLAIFFYTNIMMSIVSCGYVAIIEDKKRKLKESKTKI